MFHVANDDQVLCNESNPLRRLRDDSDEKKVVPLPHQANVFNVDNQATIPERLQNMVTKDVATTRIEEYLLNANSLGQEELISFVEMGIIKSSETFFPKNKAPTFSTLCEVKKTTLKRVRPSKPTETPISALLQHTMPVKE